MANGGEKSNDFYAVLGLNKECSASELRHAYKKLAMRWHPDRCSASENSKFVEEAKKKFQAIQQAYSVLSDANKRFLYDVGAYDSDDDENGMGDFLNEMAIMMNQTKPNENGREETFEELQKLFADMFQDDIEAFGSSCQSSTSCSATSSFSSYGESSSSNRQNSSEMNLGEANMQSSGFNAHFHNFCLGVEHKQEFKKGKGTRVGIQGRAGVSASSKRSHGRNRKVSPTDNGISAS
ncbi:hypothetical protein SLEP1_g21205 [Rubroshorea leprosula]|uniref:J domain-containing protein n=1 Tax=Rubroshorea leprosula TaxID=152421 RepID=A0AAV5J545_9ROSI|nr:hypothetical protein SLEP1_g21205 [Rubroshorea leprosula]